jgi:streptomycin 6-kinase
MEADHEAQGLRFWNGDPAVLLFEEDQAIGALLLERCIPGTSVRALPENEQDVIIAGLLRRLWRVPAQPHPFRPLSAMLKYWAEETLSDSHLWGDPQLVREGLGLFEELTNTTAEHVLLGTDVHAGNVLRARREPWLVIDPKPFIGDRSYDATQHLLNCQARLRSDPRGTIRRFADLLELDHERVWLWTFARAAAEPREDWTKEGLSSLARALSMS